MFLYAWLHLSGYADMTLEEVKNFRQLGSKTPGHPELTHAPSGVETTTGPLGQGVANAVGMAVSAKMAEARFNTPEHTIFDHHIVCLAGDGCMQEGVAMEAVEFAGHQQLDNLILIYDSNAVTLDAMAKETQSEDAAKRFEAIGCDVQTVDGHDMEAFLAAFDRAKAAGSGKPQLIIAKTLIGKGIPEVAGTQKAHGEGGAKFADAARKNLGLPDEHFYVAPEVTEFFEKYREARSTPPTTSGRRRSTPGKRPTPSWPRNSAPPALRPDAAAGHEGEDAGVRRTARRDSRVPGRHEDRHPQGRRKTCSSRSRKCCRSSSAAAPISTARRSTTSAI